MNAVSQSVPNPASENTDVFPPNSTDQWPILKDMWSFFAGNAGNISIFSVTNNSNVVSDLKLAEKVGGKLTVCTPTDEGVAMWNDVKVILKERSKSTILQNNPIYPDVAKCWVLANRVSVNKGLPCVYDGSVNIPVRQVVVADVSGCCSADVSGCRVDASGCCVDASGCCVDASGCCVTDVSGSVVTASTTTTPLVKIDNLTQNSYFDIVKIDFPGYERFVLNNLFEYGMRPSLILVNWETSPDAEPIVRAAAATLVNHGYSLLRCVDNKYLYHYNDKPFYNLVSWATPSLKNPMIEHAISFAKLAIHSRLGAVFGLV